MYILLLSACPASKDVSPGAPDPATEDADTDTDADADADSDTDTDTDSDTDTDTDTDTVPSACGSWAFLETKAAWTYTRPPDVTQPFDVAEITRQADGPVSGGYGFSSDDYTHWDGSSPSYPYMGEQSTVAHATFLCADGVVTLSSIAFATDGWSSLWGSAHAWGDEGTVSYTPAITVWDEAGTSWSTETTAHWAYTETHTGTAYSADTTETWGFAVGPAEAIGAWTGAPLTLTWSSSNTAYGNGWIFVAGTVTWIGADGVVAFGSTTTQIVRD